MKTPLKVVEQDHTIWIEDANGTIIAIGDKPLMRQAALQQIVQRVNAFDALVEACESNARVMRHVAECPDCRDGLSCTTYDLMENEASELTDAALALAKEDQCTGD